MEGIRTKKQSTVLGLFIYHLNADGLAGFASYL